MDAFWRMIGVPKKKTYIQHAQREELHHWDFSRRKTMYEQWSCEACTHSFFYRILRCPLCESDAIRHLTMPTKAAQELEPQLVTE